MIVVLSILAAGAGLHAATPAEQVRKTKAELGEAARRKALGLGAQRRFLAAREWVALGRRFDPGSQELLRLEEFYAFLPVLPPTRANFTRDTVPTNEDLNRRRHDRSGDADALTAFFATELDAFLAAFADRLGRVRGEGEGRDPAGGELVSWIEHAETQRWCGKTARPGARLDRFLARAEALLKTRGYERRAAAPGSPRTRWMDPEERKTAAAREAFAARKGKRIEEKLKALPRELEIESVPGPSPFETALGIRLLTFRSAHFQVEAPFTEEALRLALAVQEAGFRVLLEKLRLVDPGRFEVPVKSVILGSRELYTRFVMEMTTKSDEEKQFVAKRTGSSYDMARGYWVSSRSEMDPLLRDNLIACPSIFTLARFGFGKPPMWVKQGLQAVLCLEVLGTADTSYASSEGTTGRQESFHWFDYYRWRENMARAEREKLAPSTEAILSRTNVNELIEMQRAKMYCLVEFLLAEEVERFKKILKLISEKGWKRDGTGCFPALAEAGWTVDELDGAFRTSLLEK